MIRKFLLVFAWFPLALSILILLLVNLSLTRTKLDVVAAESENHDQRSTRFSDINRFSIASSGNTAQVLAASVVADDARPLILKNFILGHNPNSVLLEYTNLIVQKADQYGIDYRLPVAIAGCESNLGKHIPSKQSNNFWGIAVYTGQLSGAVYQTIPQSLDSASALIKKLLGLARGDMKGLGALWAPPSVETDYSWTTCVESFLEQMQ